MSERRIDVFNGDADGLCALRQLRLYDPLASERVTGLKREIDLLAQVALMPGESGRITVLDVSFERNRDHALRLLAEGATIEYFDHHYAGDLPDHPGLTAHIDTAPATCTSVIVDRHLQGQYRAWAVVGAFGDNMVRTAEGLAATLAFAPAHIARLRALGECINYNGYGASEADVLIHPRALFERLLRFTDPFLFTEEDPLFGTLLERRTADLDHALAIPSSEHSALHDVRVLPDAPWSRRVLGTYANALARREPGRAHAVLRSNPDGSFDISVRAALASPRGAGGLCRRFPGGGGREAAGGIDRLPADQTAAFLDVFRSMTWAGAPLRND